MAVSILSMLAACGGHDVPAGDAGGGVATPQEACQRYLSCLLIVAPQSYAANLALYGQDSECWKTPQQTANCATACTSSFADIASQCTCTGAECMPLSCGDAKEPDDSLQAATAIQPGLLDQLTICPEGDVDYYALALTSMQTVDASVTTTHPEDLDYIVVEIENASGSTLAHGTKYTTSSGDAVDAQATYLPAGHYVVSVRASTPRKIRDYSLGIVAQ